MYTVLLVDDEESVLNILQSSIDWQGLGVEHLLTASDGLRAIELFRQRNIDLLITDIRMPRMDGIELIRQVRQLQPETHCILLTAYGEFEYAREGIRLGVDNYLLKPVLQEEIIQTIQNALDNVYKKISNSESLLRENTLRRWANGTITAEELGEHAAYLQLNLYQQAFCVLCIVKRKNVSITGFLNKCSSLLKKEYETEEFWDEKGRYIIIFCGKQIDFSGIHDNLLPLIQQEEESSVICSLGVSVGSYEQLHTSYWSACEALETADRSASISVVIADSETKGFELDVLGEEIRILFYSAEEKTRQNGYIHLADKLCRADWSEEIFSMLCRTCIQILNQEFPMQKEVTEAVYGIAASIEFCQTSESKKNAVVSLMSQVYSVFCCYLDQYSPMVQYVIRYIREGVLKGEDVSLKSLCTTRRVTPAYLGHIFKKETGIFFNDYLLHCRLERSIVLLRNPNMKVKDIAEMIGFSSTSYYVKCFREYKGVSPQKYRLNWTEQRGVKNET